MNKLSSEDKINILVKEIKYFIESSKGEKAVVGISGGKDSSVVAALCVKAIGKENVIGVLMPNKFQADISDAEKICEILGIKKYVVDIFNAYDAIFTKLIENGIEPTNQTKFNLPPRLRMTVLYAIAQSINGRVMNTSNACETFVGYGTLWGDTVGDFSPLKYLTVDEIYEIGDALGLPFELVHKTPSDGLTGKSDEEVLGVSYSDIGKYYKALRYSEKYHDEGAAYYEAQDKMNKEVFEKIKELHLKNEFKSLMIKIPGAKF